MACEAQAGVVNEVRRGLRDTVTCKVARRREERAFERGDVFSGERTVTVWPDSDCHIKALRHQIHVAVTEDRIDSDLWVLGKKRWE